MLRTLSFSLLFAVSVTSFAQSPPPLPAPPPLPDGPVLADGTLTMSDDYWIAWAVWVRWLDSSLTVNGQLEVGTAATPGVVVTDPVLPVEPDSGPGSVVLPVWPEETAPGIETMVPQVVEDAIPLVNVSSGATGVTETPEPGTLGLLAAGGLLAQLWRKRF